MVLAWRDAGKLGDLDVSENGISGAADDRIQKKRIADGLALQMLATTMFPKSHRAFSRLGDAQRAAGDSTAALTSYRKSLELNPRSTDAERNAAAAVEKKLGAAP
jgi:predicted TPR repeat methyltransferase